jgi:hypothetical protein
MSLTNLLPANPRLQRTPLRAPLSRKPLASTKHQRVGSHSDSAGSIPVEVAARRW